MTVETFEKARKLIKKQYGMTEKTFRLAAHRHYNSELELVNDEIAMLIRKDKKGSLCDITLPYFCKMQSAGLL